MLSEKKASHFEDVTNANIEPNGSNETEPKHAPASARRRLFSFGIPAAAAMLATACGKAVFGGDQKRIKKDGSGDASGSGGGNESGQNGSIGGQNSVDGQNGNSSATNGNATNGSGNGNGNGNGNGDGDNSTIGNENMTGSNGNATNNNGGMNNGGMNNGGMNNGGMNNGGGGNGGGGPVTDDPCNGIGIAVVETKDIPKDSSIIDATGTAGGLKIWGRDKNATVVVGIPRSTPKGSTVMIASPVAAGSTQVSVLASRIVMEPDVDANSPAAGMIIFEAINLSLIPVANPDLVVILLTPNNVSKKEIFSGKIGSFQPKSKRYAFQFKGKPVADVQVNFLPDEDGLLSTAQKSTHGDASMYPTFGGGANGFGHDRNNETNAGDAFFAENLRTSGHQSSTTAPNANPAETAHITHAKTKWKFPARFNDSGVIVTDLLEREITTAFKEPAGNPKNHTDYLKDDYTFVVYRPDNATTPSIYYRYIISVG